MIRPGTIMLGLVERFEDVHVESRVVGQGLKPGDVVAVIAMNGFICTPQLDFLIYRSDETQSWRHHRLDWHFGDSWDRRHSRSTHSRGSAASRARASSRRYPPY